MSEMRRPHGLSRFTLKHCASLLLDGLLITLLVLALFARPWASIASAEALRPLRITILAGPRNDFCYLDHLDAIEKLARIERDRINKAGGIAGRPIEINIRNDEGDAKKTVAIVDEALSDPQSIALIGLESSDRAKEVFKQLGPRIVENGTPWISGISVTSLFANYSNVFTMRSSQDEVISVIAEFVKDKSFTRPAFLTLMGQPFVEAMLKGLEERKGFPAFVDKHRFVIAGADSRSRMNAGLDPEEISKAVADLKKANPDLIFLSVGGWRVPALLKELGKAGVTTPLFVSGRLEDIFSSEISYAGDVYQTTWDELPSLYNDRLRTRLLRERPEEWTFSGSLNPEAFQRTDNNCQERSPQTALDVLSRSNLRAIGIGFEFRDMIAMIADVSKSAKAIDLTHLIHDGRNLRLASVA